MVPEHFGLPESYTAGTNHLQLVKGGRTVTLAGGFVVGIADDSLPQDP